jgi:hypothetical protein
MVSSDRLVPRLRRNKTEEQDSSCAILGELDKKQDASGGPLQMLNTGSDSVLGPTDQPRRGSESAGRAGGDANRGAVGRIGGAAAHAVDK